MSKLGKMSKEVLRIGIENKCGTWRYIAKSKLERLSNT